jgi:antitoxin YefM
MIRKSGKDDEDLMETVHLLESPTNAARLLRSISDADAGKITERDPIEPAKPTSAKP